MLRHIAIVGTGGIGQRHAQSCASLPAAGYHLHLVEPGDENRNRATALLNGRDAVNWYNSVDELPNTIDLAIVATRADIRAEITRKLLKQTSARCYILEKVLFQKLDDYATTGRLLPEAGVSAWVNCPRRVWPQYRLLRDELQGMEIVRVETLGVDWDIGCNAIHFLDLFVFLTGANTAVVNDMRLGEVRPAKRAGMLHIEGRLTGDLIGPAGLVQFQIESTPHHSGPQLIRIETARGTIEITESASQITMVRLDGGNSSHVIPLQSQLTAPTVETILSSGQCGLASYEESRAIHEVFVSALLGALNHTGNLTDRSVCPIT